MCAFPILIMTPPHSGPCKSSFLIKLIFGQKLNSNTKGQKNSLFSEQNFMVGWTPCIESRFRLCSVLHEFFILTKSQPKKLVPPTAKISGAWNQAYSATFGTHLFKQLVVLVPALAQCFSWKGSFTYFDKRRSWILFLISQEKLSVFTWTL